jgi:DNA invertase Pin-like site-specific DNA recombinase
MCINVVLRILLKVDDAGAKFKSLTEELDTTTPMGRMVMQAVGSFAEFERSIIKERTKHLQHRFQRLATTLRRVMPPRTPPARLNRAACD